VAKETPSVLRARRSVPREGGSGSLLLKPVRFPSFAFSPLSPFAYFECFAVKLYHVPRGRPSSVLSVASC
jgi:hypothetical protein